MRHESHALPCRKHPHLEDYDYAQEGAYFVTACAHEGRFLFGSVTNAFARLTQAGRIVAEYIETIPQHFPQCALDVSVVMPNHVHFIVLIVGSGVTSTQFADPRLRKRGAKRGALGAIVGSVKSAASKLIHAAAGNRRPVWQRDYYEHVIRSEREMLLIQEYILNNPLQWSLDRENPGRIGRHPMDDWLYDDQP